MESSAYSEIYFKADGASDAGMGHLSRCLNLALVLRDEFNFRACFLIDEAPTHFLDQLDRHEIRWLSTTHASDCADRQILVFDSYRFRENDFISARNKDSIVVVIDDMAALFFDCDLIVSQGPQNEVSDYRTAKGCDFLLGVEYALIDRSFYREPRKISQKATRVFLSFGGSDVMGLTPFALDMLAGLDVHIEVVVGAGYAHWEDLQSRAGPNVHLHKDLQSHALADLMVTCDAAIASGGTMSLELMAAGVPSLIFSFAENHIRPCQAFSTEGLAHYGGSISTKEGESFRKTVEAFLHDDVQRQSIGKAIAAKFMKSGLRNVGEKISLLSQDRRSRLQARSKSRVQLVPLEVHHLDQTRKWISDPRVSRPFLFERMLTAEAHADWFESLKSDRSQMIFAVLHEGAHIGNVGFKNIDRENREAEFWIYLGPNVHGRGLGRSAAREAIKLGFDQLVLNLMYLHVSSVNAAARSIYHYAGFHISAPAAKSIVFEGLDTQLDRMEIARSSGRDAAPLRVAFMQPTFLPWLGYFELMEVVDIFVFLDDFQFSRQSWGQRNRLFLSPGRPGLVSIPIQHPDDLNASFLDISPGADQRWIDKLAKSLSQAYSKAPFFGDVWGAIEPLLRRRDVNLADFEIGLIEQMAARLGIVTKTRRSSEFGIGKLGRSERLVALLDAVGAGSYYSARGAAEYMHQDGVFPLHRLPVFFRISSQLRIGRLDRLNSFRSFRH